MNKGIMINIDDTHFLFSRTVKGIEVDEAEIRRFVRQYQGTQATDLIFSIAGRIAGYPSEVATSWIDKYLQKEGIILSVTGVTALIKGPLVYKKPIIPF